MTRHLAVAAAVVVAAGAALAAGGPQEQVHGQAAHVMALPDAITWGAGPASLPAGARAAVLEGDPAKPGAFTMRLRLPDGYAIAPHWHPAVEHVTVIQGTFIVGLGETADRAKAHALPAGAFALMPAGTRHHVWTKGDTIVQIHGTGPWGITYVNAADDPRKPK